MSVEAGSVRKPGRLLVIGLPLVALAALVALWWLVTVVFSIHKFLLPAPPDVVHAFLGLPGFLLQQTFVTLQETMEGFGLAVLVGLPVAIVLTSSRLLQRAVMPILVTSNAVPKVAVAPLLVFWLGFGPVPKVAMVFVICFFPVVVAAMSGLATTPADLGELARSLSASRWQTYVKVRLPWALPQIFVGLKVAISLALIGAIVGEISGGGDQGLGTVIVNSSASQDTSQAFAAISLLAIAGIVLFYLVVLVEHLALPWVRETSA
jgi:NitT/TauT family transport system permease protein